MKFLTNLVILAALSLSFCVTSMASNYEVTDQSDLIIETPYKLNKITLFESKIMVPCYGPRLEDLNVFNTRQSRDYFVAYNSSDPRNLNQLKSELAATIAQEVIAKKNSGAELTEEESYIYEAYTNAFLGPVCQAFSYENRETVIYALGGTEKDITVKGFPINMASELTVRVESIELGFEETMNRLRSVF